MPSRFKSFCTRRTLRRLVLATSLLLALWLVSSYYIAYRLTHRSAPLAAEPIPNVSWAAFESLRVSTADGQSLGAWYAPGHQDLPIILFLHGNGSSRSASLSRVDFLALQNYGLFLLTLRAHGDSTGDLNDLGYSARFDVQAAVAFLQQRDPARPVIIFGQSLGAAAALFAAPTPGVTAYILECPYRNLYTAVRSRTQLYLPPVLSQIAYAGLVTVSPLVLDHVSEISPENAASAVPEKIPVLILCGKRDRRAPVADAQAIQQRLGPRAQLAIFPQAGHLQLRASDPHRYEDIVLTFLAHCRGFH